eukprot:7332686-Heterocapsa_arctica.AAC.1
MDPKGSKETLQPIASSVLMKVLYAARLARFDLLKAVANLAKKVTKWDKGGDRMLHRLMYYLNSSLDMRLKGHIGYYPRNLIIAFYSDANFAGDKETSSRRRVVKSGKNPIMRHLGRTHKVNLAWLSEVIRKCDQVNIANCNTNEQAADLLTKGFTNPQVWERVRSLIGVMP